MSRVVSSRAQHRAASPCIRHGHSSSCASAVRILMQDFQYPASNQLHAWIEFADGTLGMVVPLHASSILFLVGGGVSPLFPRNKVIIWDDALGRPVSELEFRDEVEGMACRRGWLAVALRRRVVVFEVGQRVKRWGEWHTTENRGGEFALLISRHRREKGPSFHPRLNLAYVMSLI